MWPFKPAKRLSKAIPYRSGKALFEMQCKYGHTDLQENCGIAALVLDAKKEFGTSVSVKINDDGSQQPVLRVASEDGGFVMLASTPSNKGDLLKPDDVVIWLPTLYRSDIGEEMPDPRQGWFGLIIAKVALELDVHSNELRILCEYT